jgi:hypothetical protein
VGYGRSWRAEAALALPAVSLQVGTRYLPCFQELRQVLSERIKATRGEGSDD